MKRGEHISFLEEKTAAMRQTSDQYYKNTKKVKKHMLWRKRKWAIIGVSAAIIVLALVILIICWQLGVFDKGQ